MEKTLVVLSNWGPMASCQNAVIWLDGLLKRVPRVGAYAKWSNSPPLFILTDLVKLLGTVAFGFLKVTLAV